MKLKNYKILFLIGGLILFETFMYFIVKFTPLEFNLIGTSVDNKIPFIAEFVYAYISWYFMLFLVPYLLYKNNVKKFNKYYIIVLLSIILVSFIYFLYPTTIARPDIAINGISDWIVNIIYTIDTPALNCFPSMHCLISFIFIYMILETKEISKKVRIIIIIWSILIILSTIFIKQHVLNDVISAFVISLLIYILADKIKSLKDFKIIKE